MTDRSDLLLFDLLHAPQSLKGEVTISNGKFSPIPKALFLGANVEELFEQLEAKGVVQAAPLRSRAQCPKCGSHDFQISLECAVHRTKLVHRGGHSPPSPSAATVAPETPSLFCEECRGPPAQIGVGLRCSRCRAEIPLDRAHAKGEYEYDVVPDHLPLSVQTLESVHGAFLAQGFRVEVPARLTGKSGLEHFFDLSAVKEETRYVIDVMTPSSNGPPPNVAVLGYYAKVGDVAAPCHHLLVSVPGLPADGKQLAQAYGLDVLELVQPVAASEGLRPLLEKSRLAGRRTTGVAGLDPLLGGGFSEDRIYLVLGDVGSGKTMFALQFLLAATHYGEKGLLITTNTKPSEVVEMADSLGFHMSEQVRQGKIMILAVTHQVDELKRRGFSDVWQYRTFVSRVVNDISNYVTKIGASRIAIDTIRILTPIRKYDEVREFINSLGGLGKLTLLTEEAGIDGDTALEEYFVSGVIVLHSRLEEGRQARTLLIRKNRGAAHDTAIHSYTIEPGLGLKVQ